ncbi:MAG: Gfo/Idh/MocA family oxidoreductase [Planctomycetota bacterium]
MPSHENAPARVAVVGVGRMGGHHARTYHQMPGVELAAVVDHDEDRRETLADQYGCRAYRDSAELLEKEPDLLGVSVAVPTRFHTPAAAPLLERGVACLIEKPLAGTLAEAMELAALAKKHDAVLQVGHTERFNPAVRGVEKLKLVPRFMEVDRVSPMTFRSLDVGVVMDMMIHDLDILLMLAQSPIAKVDAVGVAVLGDHEDVCDARLTFANGCVATMTGSRLALNTTRKLRLFNEEAYVTLDYAKRTGLIIRKSGNDAALSDVKQQLAAGADLSDLDFTDLINLEELEMDLPPEEEDPLTAQATAFLRCAREGGTPVVSAEQGCAAIDAAERIVAAIAAHRWDGLGSTKID